jgi:hypothetical protein
MDDNMETGSMTTKSLALRLLPGVLLCIVLVVLMAGGWIPTRTHVTKTDAAIDQVPAVAAPPPVVAPTPDPGEPPEREPKPEEPATPVDLSATQAAVEILAALRRVPPPAAPRQRKRAPAPPIVLAPLPVAPVDPGPAAAGPRWPTYVSRLRDDSPPWWRLGFREGGE